MKITGAKAHKARLGRIRGGAMVREVGKAIYVAADMIAVEAAISITTGAVSGKNHVPSKPGEPPNADTHFLDRSIGVEQFQPLKAKVVAYAPYAEALEFGTSDVAPRPFMEPATRKMRPKARRLVAEAVKRVARGGTL
ncbi:HK97 gp10 family phage protein [Sphingomonas sp. C8-2]|nr:HK97 gp10 family phage protein [Sphingomonas sp. C8-2]